MRGRNTARTDLASQNSSFVYNGIPCGYITNPKTRPTLTMKNTLIKRFSNILLLAGLSTIAPLHAQELSNIGNRITSYNVCYTKLLRIFSVTISPIA